MAKYALAAGNFSNEWAVRAQKAGLFGRGWKGLYGEKGCFPYAVRGGLGKVQGFLGF
jgi:hypothetical protein